MRPTIKYIECSTCGGSRYLINGTETYECPVCKGNGKIRIKPRFY